MKVFLKTVLAIGLVASSSLALAEGKFAYRQPLQGVDASPTFGMTATEKQEHQEQSNIEMCSKEKKIIDSERSEYSLRDRFYAQAAQVGRETTSWWEAQWDGVRLLTDSRDKGERIPTQYFNTVIHYDGEYTYATYNCDTTHNRCPIERWLGTSQEASVLSKTSSYDWCVNNGYETAN